MAIDYDKLNAALSNLKSFRGSFVSGDITYEELQAAEVKIKADIRAILGYQPPPSP